MIPSTEQAGPPGAETFGELAATLLEASLTGFILFRPVYDAQGQALIDLAYEYLNPAAQHMLRLPERPPETLLTLFPAVGEQEGVLAFYGDAFLSGQRGARQFNYQHDGLDGYFHVVAQRQGERLVVSFTDTNDQPRTAVEAALRESQAREQAARAASEHQKEEFQRLVEQAPIAIAWLRGAAHVIEFANDRMAQLWGRPLAQLVGRPHFEALPDLANQGFEEVFDSVFQTGQPYYLQEQAVLIQQNGGPYQGYFNITYQPVRDEKGRITGISASAVEVTDQVLARYQTEAKERQTNFLNEELQGANEEIIANNTELKRAQRQLRQLNEELEGRVAERTRELRLARLDTERQRWRLEQLVQQAPLAICVFDGPDWVYQLVNPQYQRMFYGRELLGKRLVVALPEVADQPLMDILHRVYDTGEPFTSKEVLVPLARTAQGPVEDIYFDLTYQARRNENSQIDGFVTYALDVTEQVVARQQKEALHAQMLAAAQRQVQVRQELYQVLEQTPAAVAILRGPAHRYAYANAAFQQFYPGRALVGHQAGEMLVAPDTQRYLAIMEDVYRTGEAFYGYETPQLLAVEEGFSPELHYFNFTISPYLESGQVTGLCVFGYEVTELVRAKQQREVQQKLTQTVFEQSPTAIFVLRGPTYVLEIVNPLMEQMLGRPRALLLGRPYFEAVPELADQGFPEFLRQVWDTGEALVMQEQPGRLAYHQPHETGYFSFVYQPLRDEPQGPVTGIACVTVEVTGQVKARQQVQLLNEELAATNQVLTATNEELNATNTQLTRTNVDLDNFIYTASHDLRQPISNIEGLLALLQEVLPAAHRDEVVAPVLSRMHDSVERFKRTIANLTEVSKLQLEFAQPAVPIRLATIIEDVRQDLLPQLTEAGARLEVAVDDCLPRVFSEKNLRSIIYNLLSNALKYRHPARRAHIRVSCAAEAGYLLLRVADNGLGVDEWQQARLFQLFQRLHTHVEGSGLGLYMVKKIIENAGGTIQVESQLNVGTTFMLHFPA
ncbi:MAG: PAS domain-containing protein [Cytophagaceae bacterium]|nr:MAG: PAS domain-containing protein [Cytophagaceae bacterium]